MDLEEETPIVENRPFVQASIELDHGKSENQKVRNMSASKPNENTSETILVSGSSTDSSGWGKPLAISPPTSPSSSSSSSESYSKMKAKASETRTSSKRANKTGGIDIKRREDGVKNQEAPDQMSESYHEIFDTLMPPETAKARLLAESEHETDHEDVITEALSSCNLEKASSPTSMNADEISTSKRYLTSKLVEDSLKWQRDKRTSQMRGIDSKSPSPYSSPVHRGAVVANLHSPLKLGIPRPQKLNVNTTSHGSRNITSESSPNSRDTTMAMQVLDPNCILDIERSARHLATSVDEMVENLSGLLQGISALTVDTVETYRDGVCKTCDAVDGNIKSMYQVMAKVEELNKSMGPAYRIADQVKDIKRLLDLFENALSAK